MKKFIKRRFIVIVIIIVILLIGGYFYFKKSEKPSYDFAVAKRGDIVQEVSVTGRVKPAQEINLAFEKSGKISRVNTKISARVSEGQILVQLENSEIASQLSQAEANLKMQEIKLEELKQGTRPEEIKIYEIKVENAKISLEEANKNLTDKIQDSYTKADDAVRNKVDQFISNSRTPNPEINFQVNDNQLERDIEYQRFVIEGILNSWTGSIEPISAKNNLIQIKSFLEKVSLAVNSLTATASLSQTIIDTYKTSVSTARTNVNTAVTNLVTAEENLKTAESAVSLAEQELSLKKAGSTVEQIASQEAQIEQAEANVKNYQAQLAKTILRAPIRGIIAKQEAKVGEIVSINTPLIFLISESQFEIEANVPESDIAKIKIGNSAKITLDAYGNDVVFEAQVVKINPAETIIEGVATYKTTLQFIKKDEWIKSGMTANIDILTAEKKDVVVIPLRAIITKNGDKIVKVLKENVVNERKIKTGLRDSDANVEIIEGINEGDKVIYGSY